MSAQITHIDPEETIRKLKAKVARLEKALAAHRQWVGLTDDERWLIFEKNQTINSAINAIETKLKEKNT
jgi:hypothetical protein